MKLKIFLLMAVIFLINETALASIEITDARATPDYWIDKNIDGDKVILDAQEISKLNVQIRAKDNYAADLYNYPQTISAETLKAKMRQANYDAKINPDDYTRPAANRNYDAVTDSTVLYAVTLERVNLRILPAGLTGDLYDKLQGTAIDPAEPLAVLWESADGQYVFVQSRNYFGWVEKMKLGFTTRAIWLTYVKPDNFIVVTDNKKSVNVGDKKILFQMGAVIPLSKTIEDGDFWTARIPVKKFGKFKQAIVKIAKDDTVHRNFLPCTTNNFIRQSFKFLGDIYGWGGLDDSVDCSAFTSDIYRSMGIEIPRDADRQELAMPSVGNISKYRRDGRLDMLRKSPSGSLVLKPGHVMMLLGSDDNGTPIIIHAASSYYSDDKKIYIRKVVVSDLSYKNYLGNESIDTLTGLTFLTNSPRLKAEDSAFINQCLKN